MGRVYTTAIFLLITPLLFLLSISFFFYKSYQKQSSTYTLGQNSQSLVSYAALPSTNIETKMSVEQQDARVEIVRQFFERYGSPLEPFADNVVAAADLYDLDFRLLPAIAMQESNLCKKAPKNSHNCWGFGIYGKQVKRFPDYAQAIQTVTKTLATKYKGDNGLDTPDKIVKMYTPSDDGKWTYSVKHFMAQLR